MKIIFKDVENLYDQLTLSHESEVKICFIIKGVLLKYLVDNHYVDECNPNLKEDFTINKVIENWAGKPVDYFQEENLCVPKESWEKLLVYINSGSSLQGQNSNVLGYIYEYLHHVTVKKKSGMFYTPKEIIQHMISLLNIEEEKRFRIIDPACGSGFFLSEIYDKMVKAKSDETAKDTFILHKRIIQDQLYGIEKDPMAALIAKLVLSLKHATFVPVINIYNKDALLCDSKEMNGLLFDYVIGNPPYIGHKLLDKEYSIALKEQYGEVFYDKGDISYCFFKRGVDLLKQKGQLIFITSRYFLESLSGKGLRKYIKENTKIDEIIDFNGNRVIKGAKVDLAIMNIIKTSKEPYSTKVFKLSKDVSSQEYKEIFKDESNYHAFTIDQAELRDDGWILIDEVSTNILTKIGLHTCLSLQDISTSYQGIITGCDKAFVLERKDIHKFNQGLLRTWIKSTNIEQYHIHRGEKYLLYTDDAEDIKTFPYDHEYLLPFRERLSNRRECKNGIRKWYMLQWGRKKENFEKNKIIFPYKAAKNKFAIDTQGCFFSADIYSLVLNDNLLNNYTYEFLVCLLNSRLYEFYFKSYGKKLGGKLYEYYPNTIMRLRLPKVDIEINTAFKEYYNQIIYWKELGQTEKLDIILNEVDEYFYDFFGLSEEEKLKIIDNLQLTNYNC